VRQSFDSRILTKNHCKIEIDVLITLYLFVLSLTVELFRFFLDLFDEIFFQTGVQVFDVLVDEALELIYSSGMVRQSN
jgi:hypothetical protein